jgi:hypothetical protein
MPVWPACRHSLIRCSRSLRRFRGWVSSAGVDRRSLRVGPIDALHHHLSKLAKKPILALRDLAAAFSRPSPMPPCENGSTNRRKPPDHTTVAPG